MGRAFNTQKIVLFDTEYNELTFLCLYDSDTWMFNNFYVYFLNCHSIFFSSDYLFKLLLIGDSGVGKSCLLLRFAVSVVINIKWNLCDKYI